MKRLVILCDLDSIVINLLGPWLAKYNELYDDNKTVDDVVHYHIENIVKPECGQKIFHVFHDVSFYRSLPPLPGAVEGVKELMDAGHDVILVTASVGDSAGEKYIWCRTHMPFFPRRNLMIGARKEQVHGDVFIDDSPDNITAYRRKWGQAAKIMTIAYPYNEHMVDEVDVHARCHRSTETAWRTILNAVHEIAK